MKMSSKKSQKKTSLRSRLILAFVVTSILPIIIVNLFSYYNTSGIVKDNVKELTGANLKQTKTSLDVWLDSYEDILFQVYTDDNIVELVDKINRKEDLIISKNQLRRTLRGLFYTKEYIKSISIITEDDNVIFYDLLTGSTTQNSWLQNMGMTQQELYDEVSSDNQTHVISTHEADVFAGEHNYLFHLGHRIINYKKTEAQLGIVVVSIDEQLLKNICSGDGVDDNSMNFIVDENGKIVSYAEDGQLGLQIKGWGKTKEQKERSCQDFLEEQHIFPGEYVTVSTIHDDKFNWDIVNVSNQNEVISRLKAQQQILISIMAVSLAALIIMIVYLTRKLTGSLKNVAEAMKRAGSGEMSTRVEEDLLRPAEVETIAEQFNSMLEKLGESMEKEKQANEKQKDAEIAALEAQINPHFLYNTLDTINWMAIEKDEFEISSAINALAGILRYGIDNSNGTVTIKEEVDWLNQYLFLQQTRLKNTFECEVHVEPEVMGYEIHKLLFQPFVENAIIHGFEGVQRTHRLVIHINTYEEDGLKIEIYDNGKGIPQLIVDQMNQGNFVINEGKKHIGMGNAYGRLRMYYGDKADVKIESKEDEFTKVIIILESSNFRG